MREQFLASLRQRGVQLDQATIDATWPVIARQIGDQTARFVFGRAGQVRRQANDDPVLASAMRMAARARTPAELFQLAAEAAPPATRRP